MVDTEQGKMINLPPLKWAESFNDEIDVPIIDEKERL